MRPSACTEWYNSGMDRFLAYPWAVPFGLYFYGMFQAVYMARFGGINTTFTFLDIIIWAIGVSSLVLFAFFAQQLERQRELMLIPLVVSLPFGYIGALVGGLFGHLGVFVGGLLPFALILSAGYLLIRKVTARAAYSPAE